MEKLQLETNGLQCANCAMKIEKKLNQSDFVESAVMNFAISKLTVELKPDQDSKEALTKIQRVVDSVEDGVKLTEYGIQPAQTDGHGCESCGLHDHDHSHGHDHERSHDHEGEEEPEDSQRSLILLGISAVLFAVGLFVKAFPFDLLIYAAAALLGGASMFVQGLKSLFKLRFDETVLITIAVVAAFAIGEYPEAVLVVLLFQFGELLEDLAVSRSRQSVSDLLKIRPDTVNLLEESGETNTVDARLVGIDQTILVRPGERIPLDCVILTGSSSVDNSALTGESIPVNAGVGDALLSGGINFSGTLTCKVTAVFENSAASRIIAMVQDAAAKKAKTENFISRFAAVYTPVVIALAVLIATVPSLIFGQDFNQWLKTALVFLVSSCPCALVISIPLAFFTAVGAASKKGVLIKGSKYVETLAKADAVVFDKTGTLTGGKLSVTKILPVEPGYSEDQILQLAASAEQFSTHPVGMSVVEAAKDLPKLPAENMKEIAGKGIACMIENREILCGSYKLMQDYGVDIGNNAGAHIFVAADKKLVGCVFLADQIRDDAKSAVSGLKALGVRKVFMLTGDNVSAAQQVADACGVDEVYSNLLPQDKVSRLEQIREENGKTVFVGDGINDAPVLALADAGVAMGFGSDAAIESADAVLMSGRPSSLVDAVFIAKHAFSIMRFNIAFALIVKGLVLVLAVFGLAAIWMAVFADVGVSVLSVLNASRILKVKRAN